MIKKAKEFAPALFSLLDEDSSKTLNAKELVWITKFQKVLGNGELRNLTRDVFNALDADEDNSLTAQEVETDDAARLARVVELVQEAFPLPSLVVDTSDEAQ